MISSPDMGVTPEHSVNIPTINRSQIQIKKPLGSGGSAVAYRAKVDGIEGEVVYKAPRPSAGLRGRFEVEKQGEILQLLMGRDVEGVVKLLGVVKEGQPALIQELVSGYGIREDFTGSYLLSEGLKPPTSSLGRLRAEWSWGLIKDVLAPFHKNSVVISDAKTDDFILVRESLDDDSVKTKVVCIDLGNAGIEGKIGLTPTTSKSEDCRLIFNMILKHGFGLPEMPRSADQSLDKWLDEIKKLDKDPQKRISKICERFVAGGRDFLGKTGYQDGGQLLNDPDLRSLFADLGVVEPAQQQEQPQTSFQKETPQNPLQLIYEIALEPYGRRSLLQMEQQIIVAAGQSLTSEQAKWLLDTYSNFKGANMGKVRAFGAVDHDHRFNQVLAILRQRVGV